MTYAPFQEFFQDIAKKETRSFTLLKNADIPAGTYGLYESFCNDPGCDCRRVFLSVFSAQSDKMLAVIAYGWENEKFYVKWMGDNDPKIIKELKGPVLNLASPQSKYAPAILKLVKTILQDKKYVERIKSHYKIFRGAVDNNTKKRIIYLTG